MIENYITGASGFIGSHLVKKLGSVFQIRRFDIPDYGVRDGRFFFLSTYGNMAHHNDHRKMVRANVQDVINSFAIFRGWFCYMSSSSVTLPVQTPYSRTKRAAEEILQALPELKSCIVRPYSVTGVGEQKEHLIPTLIRSCMEGEEMPFVPWAMHDFVDVEDVVNGLIAAADSQATGIFEFGSGKMTPNQTVLEMVEDRTGRKANVKLVKNLRSYDTGEWFCKQGNAFFKHDKKLEQSISEMVEAYKREHA